MVLRYETFVDAKACGMGRDELSKLKKEAAVSQTSMEGLVERRVQELQAAQQNPEPRGWDVLILVLESMRMFS